MCIANRVWEHLVLMPSLAMCAPVCLALHQSQLCFTGVLQSDGCRLSQLRCHTAKSGHIYNKFSWGNRKSLFDEPKARGVAVRDELVQYYRCGFRFGTLPMCAVWCTYLLLCISFGVYSPQEEVHESSTNGQSNLSLAPVSLQRASEISFLSDAGMLC